MHQLQKFPLTSDKIVENAKELLQTIIKLKPPSAKGTYIKSIYLSSTMSPVFRLNLNQLQFNNNRLKGKLS